MPHPEIGEPRPLPPEPTEALPRPGWPWWKWLVVGAAILLLLPAPVVLALRWIPPPTTAFILQSPTQPVKHTWVPQERIARIMGRAVIAAEDQKFRDHFGFDLESIADAIDDNRRRRRARGASTITQQTAKNLFLWPGGGYFRKGIEAYLALWIELLWSKDRILEVYLNVAEFGRGIYGVEAAARHYFGKPASALTPFESARLTAVLPSPRNWGVLVPGPYVLKRTDWIMVQIGYGPPEAVAEEEPELPEGIEGDEAEVAEDPVPAADSPHPGPLPASGETEEELAEPLQEEELAEPLQEEETWEEEPGEPFPETTSPPS